MITYILFFLLLIIIFLHNYSLEPFLHFERGNTLSSHSFDKNPHTQIYNDDSHFYNIQDKNNLAKGNAKCCISNHQKQFVSKKLLKNLDKQIKPALESTLIESPHISYLSEKKLIIFILRLKLILTLLTEIEIIINRRTNLLF